MEFYCSLKIGEEPEKIKKTHFLQQNLISPTKCFYLKELDSMSLPLISFYFIISLEKIFCNGTRCQCHLPVFWIQCNPALHIRGA